MELEDREHHKEEDVIEGDLLRMVTIMYKDMLDKRNPVVLDSTEKLLEPEA